ncbi:hypothetical protein AVT22_gp63 [Streptomyces phage Caliburn]|uniref:DUF7296 domain-containing protein n=2 Tax=Likavirus caliburn TaxID=1982885 RepID=A0A291AVC9_9CAUD|nr:hypothetical protein AVT22_gp63 [Streptomyces phage Caliburn]AKY03373.1 hypothetical protein SEA_CALIBURN_63 [Streptomyces phage Caliburn]ATE84942.1 hypothetical protein SEA_BEARDEDLADY_64 [Streptomyces phage BeardedLady]
MAFFEYSQNNSGGSFDFDPDAGISHIVIIEADTADAANRKAEEIGLYFDGEGDCSCCGDRWYEQWDDADGDPVPSHYGEPIQDIDFHSGLNYKWIKGGPEAYVHFADGTVQGYGLPKNQLG